MMAFEPSEPGRPAVVLIVRPTEYQVSARNGERLTRALQAALGTARDVVHRTDGGRIDTPARWPRLRCSYRVARGHTEPLALGLRREFPNELLRVIGGTWPGWYTINFLDKEIVQEDDGRMLTEQQKDTILSWFKPHTKAHENAKVALQLINDSLAEGSWLPKASRRVAAALNKSQLAIQLGRAIEKKLEVRKHNNSNIHLPSHRVVGHLLYGEFRAMQTAKLDETLLDDSDKREVMRYQLAFAPVARLMAILDDTRPKPTFTTLGVSPTITTTLADMGVSLLPGTVRLCPLEWRQIEVTRAGGVKVKTWIAISLWPANTVHGRSRFSTADHCEACGHRIKNPFNWVPLLLDDAAGVPHSLMVGKDCAASVFGIKLTGELRLEKED